MSKKETKRSSRGVSGARHGGDRAAMILEMFRAFPAKKYSLKTLASASGGNDHEGRHDTKEILEAMLEQGIIDQPSAGKFALSKKQLPALEGIVDMIPSGAVFVKVEGQEKDIFVDVRHTAHALPGDRVRVALTGKGRSGDPEGEIIQIVEPSDKQYVGTAEVTRNHAFVRVDSRRMPYDIFIYTKDSGIVDGDKVIVKIKEWPADTKSPMGEIIDNLGPAGNNDTEMHAILAEFNLPYKYPVEVERAADKIPDDISTAEIATRRDFRGVATFTIDPVDAKDFDDALSIRAAGDDKWEIGVHIADVTHYVTENSIIEREGRERATSVYLVDRTIPMLPEKLSNGLCSLRPHEDKLCFSAVFEMDARCNITNEWIGRTVIRSQRRFTYEEAQRVIETGEGDFKTEIGTLNSMAQIMRRERFADGAITFDREEAKFTLDANGKPTGVYFKVMKESNQLIEEFMLLANRKVAEFVGRKRRASAAFNNKERAETGTADAGAVTDARKGVEAKTSAEAKAGAAGARTGAGGAAQRTFVYRVHDKPDPDKLAKFSNFILKFGYYFKQAKGKELSREMNKLMDDIKGKSEENIISTLAVRTMAKAYYSTDNIGHYGLAFPYYTHFTSPIRRYPDMMVHRLLARYLAGGKSPDKAFYDEQCEHSSDMEVVAADAERASVKYKMVEFMLDRIGQEFDGVISGVTERGIYVELDDTHIEGMVAVRDLGDDFYTFDEENYAMRGSRTGLTLSLGDRVQIRVKSADLQRKLLDFELTGTIDFETGNLRPIESSARTAAFSRRAKRKRRY